MARRRQAAASEEVEAAAVYVDPRTLVPWKRNPRANDGAVPAVMRSIQTLGFGAPILARAKDRRIIAGDTRFKAAMRLGLESVPVRFLDVDEATADRLAIADNRIGEVASWKEDDLAGLLREIRADGFDLSTLGFSGNELARLLAPPQVSASLNNEVPAGDEEGASFIEVIEGNARWSLVRGEALDVMKAIPDESLDAVFTDPPYSSGGQFRSDRTKSTTTKYIGSNVKDKRAEFSGDNRDQRSMLAWCSLWIAECVRVLKTGGVFGAFTDWRQYPIVSDAIQAGGIIWRGVVTWDKVNSRPVLGRPVNQCEFVLWGSKGPMPIRPELGVVPGMVSVSRDAMSKRHQAGKPVKLMRTLARVVPVGGIIYDPFAGSGSTGVAALLEGRRFIGTEWTKEWHGVALRRLREYRVEDGDQAVDLGPTDDEEDPESEDE